MEIQANQDPLEHLEIMVSLGSLDLLALRDLQEKKEIMVNLDLLDHLENQVIKFKNCDIRKMLYLRKICDLRKYFTSNKNK